MVTACAAVVLGEMTLTTSPVAAYHSLFSSQLRGNASLVEAFPRCHGNDVVLVWGRAAKSMVLTNDLIGLRRKPRCDRGLLTVSLWR